MTSPVEKLRLELQDRLDSTKSPLERNKLGQFATPSLLAMDILKYAKGALSRDQEIRFLDPAFGTGAFFSALLSTFPPPRLASAVGYEIDPHYGSRAVELWKGTRLRLEIADFTRAQPMPSEADKPNLVVCNPPYVRHHHLTAEDKPRLRHAVRRAAGIDMNGLSGLYCYFMGLTHAWMAQKALAIWLVPSEFMDVNYGQAMKDYLLNRVKLLRIHRFDPSDVQFDDALVSSAVVCFVNEKPPVSHTVSFTYGGSLASPKVALSVPEPALRTARKWTGLVFVNPLPEAGDGTKISDLFTIRRGIATGSNGFFVMTKDVAARLPRQFLRPILCGPRFLKTDCIEADEEGNPVTEKPLFLLDCNLPEGEVRERFSALWEYLEQGKRSKVHEGYICRHRKPWYSQESRLPAPLLCTYMGRKGENGCAFRFILNRSKAIAANVYLMLYPKPPLVRQIQKHPRLLMAVWRAINSIPHESLIGVGRVYGGGLYKLEPNELADAPADRILEVLPKNSLDEPTLFDLQPAK